MACAASSCFFCTTPYQILASIAVARNTGEQADLYIVNLFSTAEQVAERISGLSVFNRVKVVDEERIRDRFPGTRKLGMPGRLWLGYCYLFVDSIAAGVLLPDAHYRRIYLSSLEFVGRLMYLHLLRHDPNVEAVFFDDGDGSYVRPGAYLPSRADALARRILFGRRSRHSVSKLCLYMPELFAALNPGSTIPVERIPPLLNSPEVAAMANRIFDCPADTVIDEDVIILDTVWRAGTPESLKKQLDDIYQKIYDVFGGENIIVKRHPRDMSPCRADRKYYRGASVPFECLCANMDAGRKLLVALYSTAVVVPKMVLNQEPRVLLLFRLVDVDIRNDSRFISYYRAIAEQYADPARFMIPETMEELDAILRKLKAGEM